MKRNATLSKDLYKDSDYQDDVRWQTEFDIRELYPSENFMRVRWLGPFLAIEHKSGFSVDVEKTTYLKFNTGTIKAPAGMRRYENTLYDFRNQTQKFLHWIARKWPACSRKFYKNEPDIWWFGEHEWDYTGYEDVSAEECGQGFWDARSKFWCRACGARMGRDDWSGREHIE